MTNNTEQQTKKIYVAVTKTGTLLSRLVHFFTRDSYTHVSVAMHKDLRDMHSFGRINPKNPFYGGFVRETPRTGTFQRFPNTDAVVLEVEVTAEVYDAMQAELAQMWKNRAQYHYNSLGLFLAGIGKIRKKENYYYCSEFVQEFLSKYGHGMADGAGRIVKPVEFLQVPGGVRIYEGKIKDYCLE